MLVNISSKFNQEVQYSLQNGKWKKCKMITNTDGSSECNLSVSSSCVRIREYHPLNEWYWWYPMLLPIPFVQGYLLRYERQGINDYAAEIEINANDSNDAVYDIVLDFAPTSVKCSKSFYFDIRRSPTKYISHKKHLFYADSKSVRDIKVIDISKRFVFRWKLVRSWPIVFLWTLMVTITMYYQSIEGGVANIVLGVLFSLFVIGDLIDICNFKHR